jgi:hypothetical protein
MKFIVKTIRAIRNKYYEIMLDICETGLEQAKLDEREQEQTYWAHRFNKYLNKYQWGE